MVATGRIQIAFDNGMIRSNAAHGTGHMYLVVDVAARSQNELIIHGTRGVMHVDCYLQICTVRKRCRTEDGPADCRAAKTRRPRS